MSASQWITESISFLSLSSTFGCSKTSKIMAVRVFEVVSEPPTTNVLISSTISSSLIYIWESLFCFLFLSERSRSTIVLWPFWSFWLSEEDYFCSFYYWVFLSLYYWDFFITKLNSTLSTSSLSCMYYLSNFLQRLSSNFLPKIRSKGSLRPSTPFSTNFSTASTIDSPLSCSFKASNPKKLPTIIDELNFTMISNRLPLYNWFSCSSTFLCFFSKMSKD